MTGMKVNPRSDIYIGTTNCNGWKQLGSETTCCHYKPMLKSERDHCGIEGLDLAYSLIGDVSGNHIVFKKSHRTKELILGQR